MHRFKPSPAMIVAIVAVVLALSGGAYAASTMINGSQIKNGTVAASKLSSSAKKQLKGKKGAIGATGATGAQGPAGPKGDTGATGLAGPMGERGPEGTAGAVGPVGPVGPAGSIGPVGPAGPTEHNYGVAGLYLDGAKQATVWSPTIPMDNNNAAMATGSTVVVCEIATCELTIKGAVRSDSATFEGEAGGGLVVTDEAGAIVDAGQTPGNADFGGVKVEEIETVGLGSGSPDETEGTEIPIDWSFGTGELGPGAYVVQGTIQFFDFTK